MASVEAMAGLVTELQARLAQQEDLMNQASSKHTETQARIALTEGQNQRLDSALEELQQRSDQAL